MKQHIRLAIVPIYVVLCLLLGGASAAGYWVNLLLQLLALVIIAWAVLARRSTPMPSASRQILVLTVLMIFVIGLQLIPLPPGLWSALPGRAPIADGFRMLGMPLPWLPISLVPDSTIASAVWLLPAIAVLLGIVRLGAFRPMWIALGLIAVTIFAIGIGAIQRAGNDNAYFYLITNYGTATGFFSNANHMATLLMTAIPFVAAVYLAARARSRSAQRASALLVMLVGAAGVIVVGIAINGSLAALGLSVPVLGASALMLLSRKRKIPGWSWIPLVLITIAGVFLVFSKPLGNNLTAADARNQSVSRATSFTNTIAAAKDYFPTGTGVGSFTSVYPSYEDAKALTTTYMNHAHSDLLEITLETGIFGLAVLALFLLWWVRRSILIWRADEVDQFARAATIASAAIMFHSLVDYPLRTAAISAVFAVCCALMADARPGAGQREQRRDREQARSDGPRHLSAD